MPIFKPLKCKVMEKKTQIATVVLVNNQTNGTTYLTGQDIVNNKKVLNIWQNTNTSISAGTQYTGNFELTITDGGNTRIYDRIPNNALQKDKGSLNFIPIKFDNVSLDKSYVQFLTPNNGQTLQLLVEFEV